MTDTGSRGFIYSKVEKYLRELSLPAAKRPIYVFFVCQSTVDALSHSSLWFIDLILDEGDAIFSLSLSLSLPVLGHK